MWSAGLVCKCKRQRRLGHLLFSKPTVKQALGLSPSSSNCKPVCVWGLKGLWCTGFKGVRLMFHKLLACNYVALWHPKLSIVCPTSPLHCNKHINTERERDRSHCCPLWESSQLGFFSPCFVWLSIQNAPPPLMTMHIIIQAGSPRVDWGSLGVSSDSWHKGSVKEQPLPRPEPFMGDEEGRSCLAVDWTLSRQRGPKEAEGGMVNARVGGCVCVCVKRAGVRVKEAQRHDW